MSGITRCWRRWDWKLALAIWLALGGAYASSVNCAVAQITPDSTLPNNSRVTTQDKIRSIEGGTRAGSNLFHSFQEFSVPTGGTAFFNNALDIQNIISRVTGKSISNIDGLIRANGTANLFFLNPNGIVFGQNASLNIGGSFVATTANAIGFGNQSFFSADNPNNPPLLTVNPSALLFNQIAAAPIQNNSQAPAGLIPSGLNAFGLRVPDGRSLLLVGGNVSMNGGRLYANGGRVEIGGLAGQGTVGLNFTDNNLSLSFPNSVALADVSLINGGGVNVRAGGGGSIAVNARNLNVERDTRLLAGIDSGLGSISSTAGNIEINATGTIYLNGSAFSSQVQPGAVGNGGNINITTGSLSVTNGAILAASTFGQGDAGSVNINARDSVSFDGLRSGGLISQAISTVNSGAVGKGGDINITTGSLSVTNGAFLSATTFGRGDAGNVNINARDTVFFDGVNSNGLPSAAESLVGNSEAVGNGGDIEAVGNGGDINITTGSLFLTNGAQLVTTTVGQGNAGSVNINARDTVSFDGITSDGNFLSAAFSSVAQTGRGNGGDIRITTGELSLTNGAVLTAYTEGQGDAGSVIINARNRVSFDGTTSVGGFVTSSAAFSSVEQTGRGKGGDIRITTGELSLTNGGQLKADTEGQGDAGNVIIDARDTVSLQGVKDEFSSAIFTSTESKAGEGNKIIVSTGSFRVADGAIIDARTYSSRPGGSVTINANTFEATNGGQVITSTYSSGQAGNITLNVTKSTTLSSSDPTYADRLARFGSRLGNVGAESGLFASTNPGAEGKGGDIFVNSRTLNIQDSARIAVNSQGTGSGGNIEIQASNLTLNNQALISAETFSSQGGNIKLGLQDILLLRRGSQISTNAGTQGAGGNGGNITINDSGNRRGFVVAASRENNDITANAFSGSGGRVTINATGIFGMTVRTREDLVRLLGTNLDPQRLPTNDITAISQTSPTLSGTVTVNTPDVDPNSGLVNLPAVPVDTQVAQGCTAGGAQAQSSFIITGRGGLPPNPGEALNTDAVQVDLITLNSEVAQRSTPAVSTNPTSPTPSRIVEATGWVIDANGDVVLTANAPTVTPHSSWQRTADCRAFNQQPGG